MADDINLHNTKKLLESSTNGVREIVAECVNIFETTRWKTVSFTIDMTPKPSQRPRLNGYRVYVPHAFKNGAFFQKNVLPKLNGLFIETPCKVNLDIYVGTPVSFTKTQKCLAEMKILRPWTSSGDIDNFEKSVYDMMQPNEKRGHTGIMSNDSLIIESHTNKYYSINPRYELKISYMNRLPDSIKKIFKLER